jgi:acetyl esterase/lipase
MAHRAPLLAAIAGLSLFASTAHAADGVRDVKDLVYALPGGRPLALDLHLPAGNKAPPLVVYLHGGAWQNGNKSQYPAFLVDRGFAVASLDFRSTNDAPFPANLHDIKAGIRFLRAKAKDYGYRAERIAVMGASSGGHLAALAGVTNGSAEHEGREGDHVDQSSGVQAIVSYFGASNLTTILAQSTPGGLEIRVPALQKLFGGTAEQKVQLAKLASPVFHVDRRDPPLMLLHGDQDAQMPINQSHELDGAYKKLELDATFEVLHGVGHVGDPFFTGEPMTKAVKFLRRTLE